MMFHTYNGIMIAVRLPGAKIPLVQTYTEALTEWAGGTR